MHRTGTQIRGECWGQGESKHPENHMSQRPGAEVILHWESEASAKIRKKRKWSLSTDSPMGKRKGHKSKCSHAISGGSCHLWSPSVHPSIGGTWFTFTTNWPSHVRLKPRRPLPSSVELPTCPNFNFSTPVVINISLTYLTFRIHCQYMVLTAYLCLWSSSPLKSETIF